MTEYDQELDRRARAALAERQEAHREFQAAQDRLMGADIKNGDIEALAIAMERRDLADEAFKEFADYQFEKPNPLRARLSYDTDAELDRIASQQWLIDQIIPVDAFGMIYGPSSTYKSFHAMDLAACIASGKSWHGNDTDNPGHVLYIGAEGAAGLQARKKAWEIRHGVKLMNLGILSASPVINDGNDCRHLINLCTSIDTPTKLIVIDTLARTFAGEENSASDMGDFIRACDVIREHTGATVLVIHHSGKDAEKGARGSSALRAACDFEYQVTRTGERATKFKCTKAKDSEPMEDTAFKLEIVEIGRRDQKGRELKSLVLKMTDGGQPSAREDLAGGPKMIHDLIIADMAKSGNDFTNYNFIRDHYFSLRGAGKADETVKTEWKRGFKKLIDDNWIAKDDHGLITRPTMY